MRKGIRNFCNGDCSTSTLNQEKQLITNPLTTNWAHRGSPDDHDYAAAVGDQQHQTNKPPATLEEMILQLEMEEEAELIAKKSKINNNTNNCTHDNILRSARNAAMNQYPRFSLDGRDALYRSSFNNFGGGRHSVCCDGREIIRRYKNKKYHIHDDRVDVKLGMPAILAGENVVWCNPGVIGKLMGLDAMPIPINNTKLKLNSVRINNNRFQRHPKMDNNIERSRRPSSTIHHKNFHNINNNNFSATRRNLPLFSSSSASNHRIRNSLKQGRPWA